MVFVGCRGRRVGQVLTRYDGRLCAFSWTRLDEFATGMRRLGWTSLLCCIIPLLASGRISVERQMCPLHWSHRFR